MPCPEEDNSNHNDNPDCIYNDISSPTCTITQKDAHELILSHFSYMDATDLPFLSNIILDHYKMLHHCLNILDRKELLRIITELEEFITIHGDFNPLQTDMNFNRKKYNRRESVIKRWSLTTEPIEIEHKTKILYDRLMDGLKDSLLFFMLSTMEQRMFVCAMKQIEYKQNEIIFKKNDKGTRFYFIEHGIVEVITDKEDYHYNNNKNNIRDNINDNKNNKDNNNKDNKNDNNNSYNNNKDNNNNINDIGDNNSYNKDNKDNNNINDNINDSNNNNSYNNNEIIEELTDNNTFGVLALIHSNNRRTATVRTKTECKLWYIEESTFNYIAKTGKMEKKTLIKNKMKDIIKNSKKNIVSNTKNDIRRSVCDYNTVRREEQKKISNSDNSYLSPYNFTSTKNYISYDTSIENIILNKKYTFLAVNTVHTPYYIFFTLNAAIIKTEDGIRKVIAGTIIRDKFCTLTELEGLAV